MIIRVTRLPTAVEHDPQKHEKPGDVPERAGHSNHQGVLEDIQVVGEARNEVTGFGLGEE